jgi:hypothetical protein
MTIATQIRRATWNTYQVRGYGHQVGTDQRATGGVHLHQVRRARGGSWQMRLVDSNGRYQSPGPVTAIDDAIGEAHFATAQDYAC